MVLRRMGLNASTSASSSTPTPAAVTTTTTPAVPATSPSAPGTALVPAQATSAGASTTSVTSGPAGTSIAIETATPAATSTTVVTFSPTTTCGGGSGGINSPTRTTQQQQQQQPDLAGIFSVVFNRSRTHGHLLQAPQQQQRHQVSPMAGGVGVGGGGGGNTLSLIMHPPHGLGLGHLHHHHHHGGGGHHHDFGSSGRGSRWPSFSFGASSSARSFWTKYCLLCTICGSAATILAGIFLIIAVLFRYYTTSIYYFETVPTYIPAILLSICGVSTIAFSCKRNRNIILLRITACWSLVSAALSSVITITTSLIHMNRLQTLKECVYNKNPPSCTCFGHSYGLESGLGGYSGNEMSMNGMSSSTASISSVSHSVGPTEPLHFVFENTPDCDVIHGALYSCLRAVFAISVVAVLLSIFLCMLLYQLIGHERKKAYWSRIRRINSDWSTDFLACLPRTLPRERSGLMPLILTPPSSLGLGSTGPLLHHLPSSWGPPPPYEASASGASTSMSNSHSHDELLQPPVRRTTFNVAPFLQPKPYQTVSGVMSSGGNSSNRFAGLSPPNIGVGNISTPSTPSSNSTNLNAILTGSFPFSPTITSLSSLTSNTATTSAPLASANITSAGAGSSSSFYHPNVQDHNASSSTSFGGGDAMDDGDERQFHMQQIKMDRRSNFVPPALLQKQMTLRESKISISSDSDNLFSIEDDLFKEPSRDKNLEAKINNQIMQLLLLEEQRDARAAAGTAGTATLAVMEDMSKSSSIVTLQNDDDDEIDVDHDDNYAFGLDVDAEEKDGSTMNGSRTISSLPSSPFLNNVKKYIRERTNSLRMVGTSPMFTRKGRRRSGAHIYNYNYIEFGTDTRTRTRTSAGASSSAGGSLRDRLNCNPIPRTCHLNPNYSYNVDESVQSHLTSSASRGLDQDAENGNMEVQTEDVVDNHGAPVSVPSVSGSINSMPTLPSKVLLKSRSLPGTPMKRLRDRESR